MTGSPLTSPPSSNTSRQGLKITPVCVVCDLLSVTREYHHLFQEVLRDCVFVCVCEERWLMKGSSREAPGRRRRIELLLSPRGGLTLLGLFVCLLGQLEAEGHTAGWAGGHTGG